MEKITSNIYPSYHDHLSVVTLCSRSVKQSHYPWAAERFESSLLTLQGKPNTHARGTDGSPQATFPLSSRVVDQGHPPQVHGPTDYGRRRVVPARVLARERIQEGGRSPLAGPIRHRAYQLPYSRHVASTFKHLTTYTTHCDLIHFSLYAGSHDPVHKPYICSMW